MAIVSPRKTGLLVFLVVITALCSGCASIVTTTDGLDHFEIPKGQLALQDTQVDAAGFAHAGPNRPPAELAKVTLPDYVIEPPDILLIEGVKTVPKSPYEIQPQDILQIVVLGATPDRPHRGPVSR